MLKNFDINDWFKTGVVIVSCNDELWHVIMNLQSMDIESFDDD